MFQCHQCGASVDVNEPVPRDAECDGCRTDVRSCINCRHYDERYNNACTETQADPVPEKRRRNFCEYFYFSREPFRGVTASSREADARAKLDAMFGGGASASPKPDEKLKGLFGESQEDKGARAAEARRKLEGLFGKGEEGE